MKPPPERRFDPRRRNAVVAQLVGTADQWGLRPHRSFAAELIDFSERVAVRPLSNDEMAQVLRKLGYAAILRARRGPIVTIGARVIVQAAETMRSDPSSATGDVARDILADPNLDADLARMEAELAPIRAGSVRLPQGWRQAHGFAPEARNELVERIEAFALDSRADVDDSFAEELIDYSERIGVRRLDQEQLGVVLGTVACDVVARAPVGAAITGGRVRGELMRLCPEPFSTCEAASKRILQAPARSDVEALLRTWHAGSKSGGGRTA